MNSLATGWTQVAHPQQPYAEMRARPPVKPHSEQQLETSKSLAFPRPI